MATFSREQISKASPMRFNGTIEILKGQRAAIVTLNHNGAWSGSERIALPNGSRDDLYELGYTKASQKAAVKGGTLDTYSQIFS